MLPVTVGGGHVVLTRADLFARGSVVITEHEYGFEVRLNGRTIMFIDLLYPAEGSGDPQVVIDGGPGDEPLAKLVVPADQDQPVRLVVHKDAESLTGDSRQAIHHSGDWVFEGELPEGDP